MVEWVTSRLISIIFRNYAKDILSLLIAHLRVNLTKRSVAYVIQN